MSGSATSKSDDRNTVPRTFASLRFTGARLEPEQVTSILQASPTVSYRKDEPYKRSGQHVAYGRTGVWLLSSENAVKSADLNDHLGYPLGIVFPDNSEERVKQIHKLMSNGDVEADVGCFWIGHEANRRPTISKAIKDAFRKIPAHSAKDFHTVVDGSRPC